MEEVDRFKSDETRFSYDGMIKHAMEVWRDGHLIGEVDSSFDDMLVNKVYSLSDVKYLLSPQ